MRKVLFCILTLLWFGSAVNAQGKLTIDPNTIKQQLAQETSTDIDIRLAQKVTYEVKRGTVTAILADLTKLTGVEFKAGYNNQDWQVRDRRMNIFAKDLPLADLMSSMARVMKFKWSRGGKDNAWTYRLYMDRRTLLDAEAQHAREEERENALIAEKRQAALDSFANADNLSQAELAKLKEDNPFLYVLASSGMAGSMGDMFKEAPVLTEAITTGEPIILSASDMSASGQASLTSFIKNTFNLIKDITGKDVPLSTDIGSLVGESYVEINRQTGDPDSDMARSLMLADINIKMGKDSNINFPLFDPESAVGRTLGEVLLKAKEGTIPLDKINEEANKDLEQALVSDIQKNDFGEAQVDHPDDPTLQVKVKMTVESKMLADIEAAFAKTTQFGVISDSFGKTEAPFNLPKDDTEIKALLDKITTTCRYNWDKRKNVIEFRDRDWFNNRAAQIPDAILEKWRETLKITGTLEIDDLAEIARLSQQQFNLNISKDDVLSRANLEKVIYYNRDLLRVYAGLTNTQRFALFSVSGLNTNELSADQWVELRKVILRRDNNFLSNPDATITLACSSEPVDKQVKYKFTATSSNRQSPLNWEILSPKYEEPTKKEEKDGKPVKVEEPAKK